MCIPPPQKVDLSRIFHSCGMFSNMKEKISVKRRRDLIFIVFFNCSGHSSRRTVKCPLPVEYSSRDAFKDLWFKGSSHLPHVLVK